MKTYQTKALSSYKHMPYSCSQFYVDINFGDRLYSKEKRPGSPLLFWIKSVAKFDIKVKVTTWIGHETDKLLFSTLFRCSTIATGEEPKPSLASWEYNEAVLSTGKR